MPGDTHSLDTGGSTSTVSIPTATVTEEPMVDIDAAGVEIEESAKDISISASQEGTRARIALLFSQSFLLFIVFALAMPLIIHLVNPQVFADPIESSKSLLTAVASVLAGPFGFIVGFYFKQNSNG